MLPPPGFRDLQLTGSGATSQVYRAIDARTGRPVALKRLHRQLADSAEALARLKRELESLARLRHPSIVPVRDVIRWQGAPAVVMDFIEGKDLKEIIRERGALPDFEVEDIARALFGALSAAHAAGIVHRDVKPQNVRIAEDGRVYLLDFGSARLEAGSQLTKTGTTLGTPDYMPAELFAGTAYDPRVDIYGAGATLFECATGRLHQHADSLAELAFKRTNEDAPRVRDIAPAAPLQLAQVIDRCLARDPNDRYSTAALAAWALDHPEEERAFAMRLATRPPCLHCAAPIAPESEACSACGSDHPFSFAPGWTHVELRGVRDPARFFVELNARLPEWNSEAHAIAVAERCAALDDKKQRLVSFVDRAEAEKLARELESAGAQCELVDDDGASRIPVRLVASYAILAVALVLGQLMLTTIFRAPIDEWRMWTAPLVVLIAGAVIAGWDRVFAALKADQGLLSPRAPSVAPNAPLYFGTAAFLAFSLGLAAPQIGYVLQEDGGVLPAVPAWLMHQRPMLFWIALSIAAIGAAASYFRLEPAPFRRGGPGSPEPSLRVKLARAFSGPIDVRRKGARIGAFAAVVVLALIPAELLVLSRLRTIEKPSLRVAVDDLRRSWAQRAERQAIREEYERHAAAREEELVSHEPEPPSFRPQIDPIVRIDEETRRLLETMQPKARPTEQLAGAAPLRALDTPPALPEKLDTHHFVFAAAALFGFAFFARKQRRIRNTARELYTSIAAAKTTRAAPPRERRKVGELAGAADRLARSQWDDAFVGHAKRRTVELAHCLSDEDTARAQRALEAAATPRSSGAILDRSLLARCILETDPELELRFALLALEGELETKAAEAWAQSLPSRGEELAETKGAA